MELDDRRRAMLAEMGLRHWWPQPRPLTAPDTAVVRPTVDPTSAPVHNEAPARPAMPVRERPAAVMSPTPAVTPSALPLTDPAARPALAALGWQALQATVSECRACGLCERRQNVVFGVGPEAAGADVPPAVDWMVVGEAPGENEDRQGEPFVGQAGQLLDNMLRAIGLHRRGAQGLGGVYIANAIKCRPPGNRNPQPEEMTRCVPYLERQIEVIRPRIILAMGRFAVQALLGREEPLGRLRGQVHEWRGTPVIVTYHPAYLLRSPAEKAKAWADLKLAVRTRAALP